MLWVEIKYHLRQYIVMKRGADALHVGAGDTHDTDGLIFPNGSEQSVSSPVSPAIATEIDGFFDTNTGISAPSLVEIDVTTLTSEDAVKKLIRSKGSDRELRLKRHPRDSYSDIPPEYRPEIWGESVVRPVRLGDIILLEQTRQSKNPEYARIAESIRNEGLHKEPELDVLDREHFKALLAVLYFRVFKGEMPEDLIDQFDPAEDGLYYPATNGNTRTLILIDIAKQKAGKAKQAGYTINPYDTQVMCKLNFNRSPEEIIGSQISDNFQSSPPFEDVALTTVSHYQYLRSTGQVKTRAEYVKTVGGKFTSDILGGMIAYDKLPEPVHAFVHDKALSLSVAIEIAKLRELKLLEFGLKLYGADYQMFVNSFDEEIDDGSDALLQLIDAEEAREMRHTIDLWLTKIAADMYHRKLRDRNYGPTKQKTSLTAMRRQIEKDVDEFLQSDTDALPESEEGVSEGIITAEQLKLRHSNHRELRLSIQRELTMLSTEIANNPFKKVEKIASTLRALGQNSVTDTLRSGRNKEAVRTVLGAAGLSMKDLEAFDDFVAQRQAALPTFVAEAEADDVLF